MGFARVERLRFLEIPTKDPGNDFGTYKQVKESLKGAKELLEKYRSNQGAVGYAGQNFVSDITKEIIDCVAFGDLARAKELQEELNATLKKLDHHSLPEELVEFTGPNFTGALAEDFRTSFRNNNFQESAEAELFALMWPVIHGDTEEMPHLPKIREFDYPVQCVLAGYLDVVSELGKKVDEARENPDWTADDHIKIYGRFLRVARSVFLVLSEVRHAPKNVVSNSFGRFQGFGDKFYRLKEMLRRCGQTYADMLFHRALVKGGTQ